uniref:Pc21g00130 putative n=1 Tax=Albugo laibachii Nc14 TaxID=890382 RepID=F0X045_9STRA|nr:Pc21g00130 putative [Albugo laibachii Nc14]|eukprot:CCA27127.1 Pc21g00130 putative [Albugo laibachii Nc14]
MIVTDSELVLMAAVDEKLYLRLTCCAYGTLTKTYWPSANDNSRRAKNGLCLFKSGVSVAANTELEYETQWKELSDSFKTKPKVLEYLANTWLIYKERFVHAWTSKYRHFGNKATSRVECSHAYIKTLLQVSTGDLLSVLNKLTLALVHQVRAEETRRSEENVRYLNGVPSIFTPVCGMISAFAARTVSNKSRENERRGVVAQ